jgi:hypothetical protein
MMRMKELTWRHVGAGLAILGVIFLLGGLEAFLGNLQQYEAVPTVFGGIFLVIGAGLVIISIFEKETDDEIQRSKKASA